MEVRSSLREHVPLVTALLSAASLALVFGAALRVVPAEAVPHPPAGVLDAIPHVNAVLSLAAIGAITLGWRSIRRGAVARHRAAMGTATVLFGTFLALYLYRVLLEGPTEFAGPGTVERFVYLPVLVVHVLLAVVCVPLVYYVLLLALTRSVAELSGTAHPRVGRVAASLWLTSFSLGIVVYLLLYVLY
jgi:putative membrane protein